MWSALEASVSDSDINGGGGWAINASVDRKKGC